MFYRPEDGHGLPHNPFSAIVAPRPIAWVSTRGAMGDNLAPYSFFNATAYAPPQVMFASTGVKDTLRNVRESGVFAVNLVGRADLGAMNATSAAVAHGVDEFTLGGVARAECATIPCPRVAGAAATLECVVVDVVELRGKGNFMVLGEVTGVHLRDDCVVDGRFDATRFVPMGRMGYRDYTAVETVFEVKRPGE